MAARIRRSPVGSRRTRPSCGHQTPPCSADRPSRDRDSVRCLLCMPVTRAPAGRGEGGRRLSGRGGRHQCHPVLPRAQRPAGPWYGATRRVSVAALRSTTVRVALLQLGATRTAASALLKLTGNSLGRDCVCEHCHAKKLPRQLRRQGSEHWQDRKLCLSAAPEGMCDLGAAESGIEYVAEPRSCANARYGVYSCKC